MKKVLLIIAAYNEEANILKTCNNVINVNGGYEAWILNE